MKKNIIIIWILFFASVCLVHSEVLGKEPIKTVHKECISFLDTKAEKGVKVRVSSYNIRYAASADEKTGNGWDTRKAPLADLIKSNSFDIVGTQEGNFKQMEDLKSLLSGYDYIAYPYAGANANSHTAAIVYKKDKYEVSDQGVFWLSETPHEQSIGWDATDTRICTWAKMRDRSSGQEFYFFNAHFYWRYITAKQNSGPLMVRTIQEIVKEDIPIICTGDFNSVDSTSQIQAIKKVFKDAYDVTENAPFGPKDTNLGGGNFQGEPNGRIDYIFVNDRVKVVNYIVLSNTYNKGRHPSDHLAVVCDLILTR
ncbi:MAG TPA: endonuclease/exonuclease/phosphatase family protein [Sphingobacterium sp.]|nr:endonuclease/exonuclease/phosphatase family protein [Sphingobacterium sp.]